MVASIAVDSIERMVARTGRIERMNRFVRAISVAGFALLAAGCGSHYAIVRDEVSRRNAPFMRRHVDDVVREKGPPTAREPLTDGGEALTYRIERQGAARGSVVNWTFNPAFGSDIVTWWENTVFVVDRNGIVQRITVTVD